MNQSMHMNIGLKENAEYRTAGEQTQGEYIFHGLTITLDIIKIN